MSTLSVRMQQALKIRAAESRMVGLVLSMMLIANLAGAIGSPAIEALFYTRFGVQFLPQMYIALGIVTMAVSLLITGLLARAAREVLYSSLPLLLMAFLLVSWVFVRFDINWYYPILWLGMNVLWAM